MLSAWKEQTYFIIMMMADHQRRGYHGQFVICWVILLIVKCLTSGFEIMVRIIGVYQH
jgi:hypothetical protein